MNWQIVITLQILIGSLSTILLRRITLLKKNIAFSIGLLVYFAIAVLGVLLSLIYNRGLPQSPDIQAWIYIVIEGFCIPTAWLIQYRLVKYIGATNTVMVNTLNTLTAASVGIVMLSEPVSFKFMFGALMIVTGTLMTLKINPDTERTKSAPLINLLILVVSAAVIYSIGMYFEKLAVDDMGVWNYSAFGWSMQFVGIALIFTIFGRNELPHLNMTLLRRGLNLGLVTGLAGALYVYALSIGSLSQTIVATSGKIAITFVLAALLLNERNNMARRLVAFSLSVAGLWLIFS